MPVSSPSYFPPAGSGGQIVGTTAGNGATGVRTFLAGANAAKFTQVSDLIVVGHNAMSAGTVGAPVTDVNLAGTLILGSGAAPGVTQAMTSNTGFTAGPSVIVGYNNLPLENQTNQNVVVGTNILPNWTSVVGASASGNVLMGDQVGAKLLSASGYLYRRNVVIGHQAGSAFNQASNQFKNVDHNVIIGWRAVTNIVGGGGFGGPGVSYNVIIGEAAGTTLGNTDVSSNGAQGNIFIGYNSGDSGDASGNVLIGFGARGSNTTAPLAQFNVGIGSAIAGLGVVAGASYNVVVGAGAANGTTNNRCVLFGGGAGSGLAAADDQFLIETFDAITRRALLYGKFAAASPGGLIVGHSTEGTNRDLPGFNILKVLNGSVTGVAPVGGGFLYSLAGRLHWVDTGNVDWVLTGTAAGQLGASLSGYTNNAGAQAATITNGPTAGNPTKWIPINDNGTIRNIPAW